MDKGKGKLTAVILAKLKPGAKPAPKKDEGGGEDYDVGLESAVADFFESGKKGDYAAAASALKDAINSCK